MIFTILAIMFVMAPAFAVWEQRRADRNAESLVREVRAELRKGGEIREAPPPKKLVLWPYAIIAIVLSTLWALGAVDDTGSNATGVGIISAFLVWLAFHTFIFVKRTSTFVSLIILVAMAASAAGLARQIPVSPSVADLASRLR